MKILNWNIEWARPTSARGRRIKEIVEVNDPDLICLTEATRAMIPDEGYTIESDADYGYAGTAGRRKVILWSSEPWNQVNQVGSNAIPGGRFISGVTQGIRFVGVCIPWRDAHVRTGRKDRRAWEDHLAYLDALGGILGGYTAIDTPVCVLGDYNQRIPRTRQPQTVSDALEAAFGNLTIATAGVTDGEGLLLIDHLAVSSQLSVTLGKIIGKRTDDGVRISDHVGVCANLAQNSQLLTRRP